MIELRGADPTALHTELSRAGFRRSRHLAYRPTCRGCRACVPVRIVVEHFTPNRTLRRERRRHHGELRRSFGPALADGEHFDLFRRYVRHRHAESEMALMQRPEFVEMLEETPVRSALMSLRTPDGRLVAACLCDRLGDGVSAVYSYFEPEAPGSLGSHIVWHLVEAMQGAGRPHVYLGYWVDGSHTMAYKRRFAGLEALIDGAWRPIAKTST